MYYICVPCRENAKTVGLVLWKARQVLSESHREYHFLVADDASQDDTANVLDRYQHALPMTVFRHREPMGYSATLEGLLRRALQASDRPKRDCVITMPADFTVSPAILPDLIKRFESGADVVIAEGVEGEPTMGGRWARRAAAWLLRPGVSVPGVRDLLSGVFAFRLMTLKRALGGADRALLVTDGTCANAELAARIAAEARQIAALDIPRDGLRPDVARRTGGLRLALELFRLGRTLQVPEPQVAVQRAS